MFIAIHSNNETKLSKIIATGDLADVIERAKHYMPTVWHDAEKIEELIALTNLGEGVSVWSDFAIHAFNHGYATATIAVHSVEVLPSKLLAILDFDAKGDDFSAL